MKKLMLFFVLVLPIHSFAWGPIGHRAVALIAETQLTAQARTAVQRILGRETMADVANWADGIKSSGQYRQTVWYHFEKMPDGIPFMEHVRRMPEEMKQKGGLVEAILVSENKIRSPATAPAERYDALKFLIHFMGDLQQPLHTGKPEDNGGNKIPVKWFGADLNLHSVWDSGMLMTGHRDILDPQRRADVNAVAYARFLLGSRRPSIRGEISIERWLNESLALRPRAYDPRVTTDQDAYQTMNLPVIDQRIYEGGFHLAAVLNNIFQNEPVPSADADLWRSVQAVFPLVEKWISLRP